MPILRPCAAAAIALLAVVASAAPARAEAPTTVETQWTRRNFPLALIDRPLQLAPGLVQATVEAALTNTASSSTIFSLPGAPLLPGDTSENLAFGVDVGLPRHFQAGLFFDFPLGPKADFGLFVFDVQARLSRVANLRLDLGAERVLDVVNGGGPLLEPHDAFVVGLGVPIKVRLLRWLAFVSGSSAARGFGAQPTVVFHDQVGTYNGVRSDDLFTLLTYDQSSAVPAMGYQTVIGAVKLPLGLVFQPHARVALGVRTGYRLQFTKGDPRGGTLVQHEIPLAFDLVVSPIRQLDLGFSAAFAGRVAQNGNGNGSYENAVLSMGVVNLGWGDERQFSFWVAGRI